MHLIVLLCLGIALAVLLVAVLGIAIPRFVRWVAANKHLFPRTFPPEKRR